MGRKQKQKGASIRRRIGGLIGGKERALTRLFLLKEPSAVGINANTFFPISCYLLKQECKRWRKMFFKTWLRPLSVTRAAQTCRPGTYYKASLLGFTPQREGND
ncbi:unnamed protein product [Allacma fusca]|uniref:Uncharacterized protein n=1 Tax=Allacma fusca TaxID=39272 RepID=A0A8J2P425_9HEXA|nr:unnamed protein product [Allacma fusca]